MSYLLITVNKSKFTVLFFLNSILVIFSVSLIFINNVIIEFYQKFIEK